MQMKKAFTLIELLVVVAIIGLLMSILIPSLRIAKQKASGVVCLSNVKNLSAAWHTYAMENDEMLVAGHIPLNDDRDRLSGTDYLTQPWWVEPPQNQAETYMGAPGIVTLEYEQIGIQRGALFPYLQTVDVYNCPGNKSRIFFPDTSNPKKPFFNSYSITGLMNGEEFMDGRNPSNGARKMNHISNPGGKIVFIENVDSRGWVMGSWLMNPGTSPSWIDPLGIWHGEQGSIGFADGHADMRQWVDESTIDNALPHQPSAAEDPFIPVPPTTESWEDINYMSRGYVPR